MSAEYEAAVKALKRPHSGSMIIRPLLQVSDDGLRVHGAPRVQVTAHGRFVDMDWAVFTSAVRAELDRLRSGHHGDSAERRDCPVCTPKEDA